MIHRALGLWGSVPSHFDVFPTGTIAASPSSPLPVLPFLPPPLSCISPLSVGPPQAQAPPLPLPPPLPTTSWPLWLSSAASTPFPPRTVTQTVSLLLSELPPNPTVRQHPAALG
ncbi:hypothetical protein H1C71_039647 [Ictidomys tridecemlineatus]|nr:hypothetical protein H1C71_039647 [Ictidomys tridecemlineatus]